MKIFGKDNVEFVRHKPWNPPKGADGVVIVHASPWQRFINLVPIQVRNAGRHDVPVRQHVEIVQNTTVAPKLVGCPSISGDPFTWRPGQTSGGSGGADGVATSGPSLSADAAASKIQSAARGFLARQRVKVETLEQGIVHTRIQGSGATFAHVGMPSIDAFNGERRLDIVALRSDKLEGHVLGGDRRYENAVVDPERNIHSMGMVLGRKFPGDRPRAFINGGYYNSQKLSDKTRERHVPIGPTTKAGGVALPSLPIPGHYADRYATVSFPDQSSLTCGPVLSEGGRPVFVDADLENPLYRFQNDVIRPGELTHSEHPNPRSLISEPGAKSSRDSYRLAVGTNRFDKSRGGAMGPGFTMPEWARVASRLDQLNEKPGRSVNLDGGASSMLGVVGGNLETKLLVNGPDAPTVSTFIAFAPLSKEPSKDGE